MIAARDRWHAPVLADHLPFGTLCLISTDVFPRIVATWGTLSGVYGDEVGAWWLESGQMLAGGYALAQFAVRSFKVISFGRGGSIANGAKT